MLQKPVSSRWTANTWMIFVLDNWCSPNKLNGSSPYRNRTPLLWCCNSFTWLHIVPTLHYWVAQVSARQANTFTSPLRQTGPERLAHILHRYNSNSLQIRIHSSIRKPIDPTYLQTSDHLLPMDFPVTWTFFPFKFSCYVYPLTETSWRHRPPVSQPYNSIPYFSTDTFPEVCSSVILQPGPP